MEDKGCCEGDPCECAPVEKAPKKAKKAKLVDVQVIRTEKETALVEWADREGMLQRAYVPTTEVTSDQVSSDTLDAGISYGVAFEDIWKPSVTATQVAQELRRRGIWTREDVFEQPNAVIVALQAAYGLDLGRLQSACKEATK